VANGSARSRSSNSGNWLRRAVLSPDDMVWNEQGNQWTSANAVEGLLDLSSSLIEPNNGLTTPLDEPAKPNATRRVIRFDDRTAWCWGVFLVATGISIFHLCICVWFDLDYSRLLWFPTMTLEVVIAGLAFAVASVCSVVCFAKDCWFPPLSWQGAVSVADNAASKAESFHAAGVPITSPTDRRTNEG